MWNRMMNAYQAPTNIAIPSAKPKKGNFITNNIEGSKVASISYDGYERLDRLIKQKDLDMFMTTNQILTPNLFSATITGNTGTVDIPLPRAIYGGLAYFADYTITGSPTSYKIKSPFASIQWEIFDFYGNKQTFTFDEFAIGEYQKFMAKSNNFKEILSDTFQYDSVATSTNPSQIIFMPLPGFLLNAPKQILSEMLLPIRKATASKLKVTFHGSVNNWVEFNGGTTPAITLDELPDIRYTNIASPSTEAVLFNFFGTRKVPVWEIETKTQTFTTLAAVTNYTEEIHSPVLTSQKLLAGVVIKLTEASDTIKMSPLKIKSKGDIGIFKGTVQILSGTSNALKIKAMNTFDTLPSDTVSASTFELLPIFVSSANPFNISSVARDYIDIGDATDYRITIRGIDSGLTASTNYVVNYYIFNILYMCY